MNALAKFAPAPYFVTTGTYPRIQDASGRNIAKTDCSLNGDTNWEKDPEKARANADLLASAPEMAEALLSILALYKEDPDDLETMDKGIKLMEPVLRKAGLLS